MSASAAAAGGGGGGGEDAGEEQVFAKPGQKFPTPSPGSGARVFYETLLQEKPECLMALQWCVEHGLAMAGAGSEQLYKRLQAVKAKTEAKGRK